MVAGVLAWRVMRVAGPPMASSRSARRSSSATVTGSAGSPWAYERAHGVEDVAVGRLVEVVGRAGLDRGRDGVARQQHGAEQRFLGLQVVRRHPARGAEDPELRS